MKLSLIFFVCFLCLFVCLFICLFIYLFVCLFVYLFVCLFIYFFVYLFVCLFVYFFVCLFVCFLSLFVCLFVFFVCLSKIISTLIIAPVTLLGQWKRELESRFGGSGNLKVYMYHTQRKRQVQHLIKFDVVLTSFSIIRAECRRPDKPLHDIYWHRVVLDESHYIKALGANRLLAEVCALQSRFRYSFFLCVLKFLFFFFENLILIF